MSWLELGLHVLVFIVVEALVFSGLLIGLIKIVNFLNKKERR